MRQQFFEPFDGMVGDAAENIAERGQGTAATRLCSGAAGRRGRSCVIGTRSVVLRQIFDIHSL